MFVYTIIHLGNAGNMKYTAKTHSETCRASTMRSDRRQAQSIGLARGCMSPSVLALPSAIEAAVAGWTTSAHPVHMVP